MTTADDAWRERIAKAKQRIHDAPAELAEALLGAPTSRSRRDVRYGRQGSLSIVTDGADAGVWYRHGEEVGGDFLGLVQQELNTDFVGALEWVESMAGIVVEPAPSTRPAPTTKLRGSDKLNLILSRCKPVQGTLAQVYLEHRGCFVPPDSDLRYLPPSDKYPWPTMVAIVTDFLTGERLTLHFTRLAKDGRGKAPIEQPRTLLAEHEKRGGVIRLTPDADVDRHLGVGEGIETSLAVTAGLGKLRDWLPVWATIDAGNLRMLPVAPGIQRLTIFTDIDPPKFKHRGSQLVNVGEEGQRATQECARRWRAAHRRVYIAQPFAGPSGKGDWNDDRVAA